MSKFARKRNSSYMQSYNTKSVKSPSRRAVKSSMRNHYDFVKMFRDDKNVEEVAIQRIATRLSEFPRDSKTF